ncbi:hypothetical protein PFMALIP_05440 [Plasmodium falciparum MaliPS096_E11]|uniref:Ubiquitin carboxyl-terminal hydrolase n=2 Tax=Plasmodium falciparum TaxID=5833 RepID=A0A024WJ37_PLAFA|nr:hypothetical protein PFMALIP_05440 [Plasmodium falciparum MaliPS096_E11]
MAKNDIWTPLESNPDSLYLYSCKLGQSKLKFVDIYGFNNDLLDMIPQPVQAVIFLYPVNDNIVSENNTNDKHNLKENFDNVWFIKQVKIITLCNMNNILPILYVCFNSIVYK